MEFILIRSRKNRQILLLLVTLVFFQSTEIYTNSKEQFKEFTKHVKVAKRNVKFTE